MLPRPRMLGCCCALLTTLVVLWVAGPLRADERGTLRITAESFDSMGFLEPSGVEWRRQVGDDPAWGLPDFDDASWEFAPSLLQSPGESRAEVVWYRLHVDVDAETLEKSLYVAFQQMGAIEVYLDGRLLEIER